MLMVKASEQVQSLLPVPGAETGRHSSQPLEGLLEQVQSLLPVPGAETGRHSSQPLEGLLEQGEAVGGMADERGGFNGRQKPCHHRGQVPELLAWSPPGWP